MGGYQILDLSGLNFTTDSGLTVKGIHELCEGTMKVLLIHGVTLDNKEYRDCWLNDVKYEVDSYVATFFDKLVKISDDDLVTFTAKA